MSNCLYFRIADTTTESNPLLSMLLREPKVMKPFHSKDEEGLDYSDIMAAVSTNSSAAGDTLCKKYSSDKDKKIEFLEKEMVKLIKKFKKMKKCCLT